MTLRLQTIAIFQRKLKTFSENSQTVSEIVFASMVSVHRLTGVARRTAPFGRGATGAADPLASLQASLPVVDNNRKIVGALSVVGDKFSNILGATRSKVALSDCA